MRVNDTLARAVHLTMSSQRNNLKYTKHKKLDQRVSDFQKAALLQKCHQINEQENKLGKSETVDKLLSDASKICSHSSNAVSSNHHSSCIHTPCDPLFDFETTTSSTSLSGSMGYEKPYCQFKEIKLLISFLSMQDMLAKQKFFPITRPPTVSWR
jgi:hypothetical protein